MTASPGQPRRLTGRCITVDTIDAVDVVRNGQVVHSVSGDERRDVTLEWEDGDDIAGLAVERELAHERFAYYYLRVRTVNSDCGWSSPIWVHHAARGQ